jgi:uncharacterized membrane protein
VEKTELTTQRIEAFSDGVFAIAITLLILEIRVPEHEGQGAGWLGTALWELWPSYFAYLLSFLMIGIYWANHHYIFKLYRRVDHAFNLLNVGFLMCISFLPFPTAVLARQVMTSERPAAVTFYALGLLLPAMTWFAVWLYASHGYRLIDRRLEPGFVRRLTRQYLLSNLLYLAAILVSFLMPVAGLAVCGGLTLLYLLPPPRPSFREPHPG